MDSVHQPLFISPLGNIDVSMMMHTSRGATSDLSPTMRFWVASMVSMPSDISSHTLKTTYVLTECCYWNMVMTKEWRFARSCNTMDTSILPVIKISRAVTA